MKSEIQKFFKGEVEDDEETLVKYSHDASLLEVRPKLVLFPKDSEDVKNLVKWVSENKDKYEDPERNKDWANLSITARCAGTDMSGGAIGESIILDFTKHMNKLIGFPPSPLQGEGWGEVNPSITVQPGMFYRDFEKITLEKGLILPCFTASKSINAMGGMFGNNSAGERTLKYGQTENYILSAKVIFADGAERTVKPVSLNEISRQEEIYAKIYDLIKKNKEEIELAKPKVRKNSAGYYLWNVIHGNIFDLNKLLVGSQGTLGIATEITFKLMPNNKHSKLVAIFMNDLTPLGHLVDEILTLDPETLEAYDDKTMRLAVKFFPDFFKNKGFIGMIKFMWSFLPEFFMMLSSPWGGFPKLILLAEFAGADEIEVHNKCMALAERIKNFKLKVHITKSEAEADKYWNIRRESFALLRKHVKGMQTAPFIDDIIVRPEFLPKFLPELNIVLNKYNLTYTLAGHAGDGNFHIIPLMDFSRSDMAKIILELSEKVYNLVAKYRGSITAEHNDGLIRTPYLSKMYNEKMIEIFKEIKEIFDPKNIFNPGKKVPVQNEGDPADDGAGTKEYITKHIAIEHKFGHKV
ncbi:FAD-binding oxidoreductase [Candidatus Nomurabacteria bacterium]|nr:FAD-binding oxidoreductase [Candidatus Nomurabacteria bacterium]